MGRFNRENMRPIIVKLSSRKRKEKVNVARRVENAGHLISEDFSPAVRGARRNLLNYARAQDERFKLNFNKFSIGISSFVLDAVREIMTP